MPKKTNPTIAVAVSGGCDSLYALVMLHEQLGARAVFALHGRFLDSAPDATAGLQAVCDVLGIALHVHDCRAAFAAQVVEPFIASYARAQTPNPCVLCNATMKFGTLWAAARALGADALATGHYAGLVSHPRYGQVLQRGADSTKDQSYFLGMVTREALQHAVFPLAGVLKQDARAFLQARGFVVPLPKESQEICFVPGDEYRAFLTAQGLPPRPGAITLADGTVLGRHNGLWQYTEGQRRGLGLAWSAPLYVLAKNVQTNTLIVGEREACVCTTCHTATPNLLVAPSLWPGSLYAQLRYRQKAVPAAVLCTPGALQITFPEPQDPPAAGQLAAVYDPQGYLLAAGMVE